MPLSLLLAAAAAAAAAFLPPSAEAAMRYPRCWVREGECLDSNAGPLQVGVTPQTNPNVIGEAVQGVHDFENCSSLCFQEDECRRVQETGGKITILHP